MKNIFSKLLREGEVGSSEDLFQSKYSKYVIVSIVMVDGSIRNNVLFRDIKRDDEYVYTHGLYISRGYESNAFVTNYGTILVHGDRETWLSTRQGVAKLSVNCMMDIITHGDHLELAQIIINEDVKHQREQLVLRERIADLEVELRSMKRCIVKQQKQSVIRNPDIDIGDHDAGSRSSVIAKYNDLLNICAKKPIYGDVRKSFNGCKRIDEYITVVIESDNGGDGDGMSIMASNYGSIITFGGNCVESLVVGKYKLPVDYLVLMESCVTVRQLLLMLETMNNCVETFYVTKIIEMD